MLLYASMKSVFDSSFGISLINVLLSIASEAKHTVFFLFFFLVYNIKGLLDYLIAECKNNNIL